VHDRGEEMQTRSDLFPAEQHYAQKAGFQEESGQDLVGEQRAGDATGEPGEVAPVRPELIGHDEAGDYAHGEIDGEDLRPEMIEVAIDRILAPQPQALEHRQVTRKTYGDGRENDVERDREPELDPRQFQRAYP
jgi:hypothetical protein